MTISSGGSFIVGALAVVAPAWVQETPPTDTIDANFVIASANSAVVTVHDVLVDWSLLSRRNANPDRPAFPTRDEQQKLAKQLVIERLWLAHAKAFPFWPEIVTDKMITDEARDMYGALWIDPKLPADEHDLMRAKAESSLAMQIALQSDPEFKRVSLARPSDVQRSWDLNPELHRVPTRVALGRVTLGRALHGAEVESKAARLRQLAVEKASLEAAAAELAPGDYAIVRVDDLERDQNLRDDVLAFARGAEAGELSMPIAGEASVMLFCVVSREPGRELTFEEASSNLKRLIENRRRELRAQQYFVFNILTQSFFLPQDLFDDEIEQLVPGTKANKTRQAGN
ncbi:MAG: peptidyl-prolyl cis-trans isomerase [Planctomycetes bacterium]|nr:peptidyl-prolyl cis-trans isomerase [Planctomycetota bacterium]